MSRLRVAPLLLCAGTAASSPGAVALQAATAARWGRGNGP